MNNQLFDNLINRTLSELESDAVTHPELYTKSGEAFEPQVVSALNCALEDLNIDAEIKYQAGGHSFPDIIITTVTGEKYGIEVKSSTSKGNTWKINGNSVMGSTSEPDIIRNVIIFGKLRPGNCLFKARDYKKSIANVVVTHSPRYFIDLDLNDGESFFDESKISYEDLVTSDDPIKIITDYFHSQGHKAWWLSEKTPAAIRQFGSLSNEEQEQLIGYGFVHFPELLSRNSTKFHRLSSWLVLENSIVDASLRDRFTAGGKVDLVVSGHAYNRIPQIFRKVHHYRKAIINQIGICELEQLQQDWNDLVSEDLETRIAQWIRIAAEQIKQDDIRDIDAINLLKNIIMD